MTEKSLLSMREIARELNLNYRIMLNYKNQIQNLLPEKTDGQFSKYPADCVDLFRLVSALREEGFTFEMIRTALTGKESPTDDSEINEWISAWADKLRIYAPDQSGEIHADLHQSGLIQISTNSSELNEINLDQSGLIRSNADQSVAVQTKADQSGPIQIEPEQSGPVCTNPDISMLIQSIGHIQNQISDLIATQAPDLLAQLNASLTQFYKFCQTIAERMDRLENELGIEHVEHMELDLEIVQVSQTQSYAYADLEFVRNSVSHGKPDKDAVRQWLVNERQTNPAQSYATLAENLNQAGIPTLSGRDTWNRGTLRNLITER